MTRRRVITAAVAAAPLLPAALATGPAAVAQSHSTKPITAIVPGPAGSSTDMVPNDADQKGHLEVIKKSTAYEKEAIERIGFAI